MNLLSFIPNTQEIAKLALTPAMVEHFDGIAQQVVDAAKSVAPVDTGDYQRSIQGGAYLSGDEMVARVNAFDYKAWWIEMGTEDTPVFAPLQIGADLVGLHLEAERG